MAPRPILGLVSSMLVLALALAAGTASAVTAQDIQCSGELTGVTVRNVTVASGGSCTLRNSEVTGSVSAAAASYFRAAHTQVTGDVVGTDAQTLFLDEGSKVQGNVRAGRVAQVFVFSTRVRKNIKIAHATDQVFICASTVERGGIEVTRSARNIVIGDPKRGGCGGNSVRRGDMSVLRNTTDVQLVISGNHFPKGNLLVSGNTGTSSKIVQGNSGGRRIACRANAGSFRAVNNRRWKTGACGRHRG
jgi:hypothetical protein